MQHERAQVDGTFIPAMFDAQLDDLRHANDAHETHENADADDEGAHGVERAVGLHAVTADVCRRHFETRLNSATITFVFGIKVEKRSIFVAEGRRYSDRAILEDVPSKFYFPKS